MAQFQFGSSTPSAESTPAYSYGDSDEEDTLPYPGELPRNDFLKPNFDPQTYLSSLRNRHQTLEDLRTDLRQRSQLLNRELLDLVNSNYEEFLSLGGDLKGGEEKVEGVRVGLLGFQREVEGVRAAVKDRAVDVDGLLKERKSVRRDVVVGRALLEVEERLTSLEESLGITTSAHQDTSDDGLDDEDGEEAHSNGNAPGFSLKRLEARAEQYLLILRLADRIGPSHPFLAQQQSRLDKVRQTLLLDLSAALRQAKSSGAGERLLGVVRIYGDLGAKTEAVKALKAG